MSPVTRDWVRTVADRMLTGLAVLGTVALVGLLAGPLAGVHAYVVRSGSMTPTFDAGALVVAHRVPVNRLQVGDVVSVSTPQSTRVAHRLVARGPDGLVLRGDANRASDPAPYAVGTADRVFWAIPMVGYAVATLVSPLGLVLAGLLVLGCALVASGRRIGRPGLVSTTVVVGALVGLSVVGPGASRPAWAAPWTDPVSITGSAYTASTVAAPTVSCGVLGVLNTTITWTAVPGATNYRLHYGVGGATTETVASTVTSKSFTSVSTGTFWVETLRAFGATTWVSASSNQKAYTVLLTVAGTCS